jgi:hypothetical protein
MKVFLDKKIELLTCKMCEKIAKDPVECNGTCQRLVCKECFQGKCCAVENAYNALRDPNPLVLRHLESLKFVCVYKSKDGKLCDTDGGEVRHYQDALDHKRRCINQTIDCPFKCGETGIHGMDLEAHMNKCDHQWKICETCKLKVFKYE